MNNLKPTSTRLASAREASLPQHATIQRRGTVVAWSIFGILFAGLCAALTVNSVWVFGVRGDSERCVEAAALAAAQTLLEDELLRQRQYPIEQEWRLERSRDVAVQIASAYQRLHHVPALRPEDVQFLAAAAANADRGAETKTPAAVRVTLGTGTSASGIPLFLSGLTGVPSAANNCSSLVELRCTPDQFCATRNAHIPMLPAALLESDTEGAVSSWTAQIEQFLGGDAFSWNADRKAVEAGPDGLPEITLEVDWRESATGGVFVPLLLGDDTSVEQLTAQFRRGLSAADLAAAGKSAISLPSNWDTNTELQCDVEPLFKQIIGMPRIICLARFGSVEDDPTEGDANDPGAFRIIRPVAARVMQVRRNSGGGVTVTFQPCVISTVTARMSPVAEPSRYVYRLQLRH